MLMSATDLDISFHKFALICQDRNMVAKVEVLKMQLSDFFPHSENLTERLKTVLDDFNPANISCLAELNELAEKVRLLLFARMRADVKETFIPVLNMEKLSVTNRSIGCGGTAIILFGTYNGSKVAVKKLRDGHESFNELNFQREARFLQILSSREVSGIVRLWGVDDDHSPSLLVLEVCMCNLAEYVLKNEPLLTDVLDKIGQCCTILVSLTEMGILHRDIKPENFLVTDFNSIKLADFGCAMVVGEDCEVDFPRGTLPYVAPELLMSTEYYYSEATEMYSFAIMINNVLGGEFNYFSTNLIAKLVSSHGTYRPILVSANRFSDHYSLYLQVVDTIQLCWNAHPLVRLKFADLKRECEIWLDKMRRGLDTLASIPVPVVTLELGVELALINEQLMQYASTELAINNLFIYKGANSILFSGVYGHSNVVIKSSLNSHCSHIHREAQFLEFLKNAPDVIRYYGVDDKFMPTKLLLEQGMCNLKQYIGSKLLFDELIRLLIQCSHAFAGLVSLNVLHRNIKTENVLIMQDRTIRVIDFSCATMESTSEFFCGTLFYSAPELLFSKPDKYVYNESTEMYSFAVMMNDVLSGVSRFDYDANEFMARMYQSEGTFRPKMFNETYYSPENAIRLSRIREMIESCWNSKPSLRFTFRELYFCLQSLFPYSV